MFTPDEFRERWGDGGERLVPFPAESLAEVNIPPEHKSLLVSAGLPGSAAPFLDFEAPNITGVPTAAQHWQLPHEFERYRVIGSNGSGDPICLDESADGAVVYLNHDDNLRRVLINSSTPQLAESLLAFRHLVQETQRRNGQDAYLDGNVPRDLQEWLSNELSRIDPVVLQEDSLWAESLANFAAQSP